MQVSRGYSIKINFQKWGAKNLLSQLMKPNITLNNSSLN